MALVGDPIKLGGMNNLTPDRYDPPAKEPEESSPNPYLELSFWRFAILATLVTAFLPWSLLFNLLVKGVADTKLLVSALLRDYLQTLLAIAVGIVVLLVSVVVALFYFWPLILDFFAGIWASVLGSF
jgi:hypothetical protein